MALSSPKPTSPHPDARLESLRAEFDRFDMAGVIERTPQQIAYALTDPEFAGAPKGPYDSAFVLGMGGSALPVEVLCDAFAGSFSAPVAASRAYEAPAAANASSLVIASSFSGNTEETLDALNALPADCSRVAVLTAGGRLADHGREHGFPTTRIPHEREGEGFQPRCAIGYFVTYIARLLTDAEILSDALPQLELLIPFLEELDPRADAARLAHRVGDRILMFYSDARHAPSIARIAKIKINENSKRPAFYNDIPELNHNEMIGMSRPFGHYSIVYLRDPDSHPRVHERFSVMQSVFQDAGLNHVDFTEWTMPGTTAIQKVFAGLTFADWLSYSIALLDHIDPTPVDMVEQFKQSLSPR